jgi:hypothetical protein
MSNLLSGRKITPKAILFLLFVKFLHQHSRISNPIQFSEDSRIEILFAHEKLSRCFMLIKIHKNSTFLYWSHTNTHTHSHCLKPFFFTLAIEEEISKRRHALLWNPLLKFLTTAWISSYDALPSHGVKPTWGSHKVKLRKVETWRHAPGFQL